MTAGRFANLTLDELLTRMEAFLPQTQPQRDEAIATLLEISERFVSSASATDRFLSWMEEDVGDRKGIDIAALVRKGGFDPWAGPSRKLPDTIDVDDVVEAKTGIRYIGAARRQENGKYTCLADVNGSLCLVEVNIRFGDQ